MPPLFATRSPPSFRIMPRQRRKRLANSFSRMQVRVVALGKGQAGHYVGQASSRKAARGSRLGRSWPATRRRWALVAGRRQGQMQCRPPSRDDAPLRPAGIGEDVLHEVDATALIGRTEHRHDGGLQTLVGVGDDQFCAAQAARRAGVRRNSTLTRSASPWPTVMPSISHRLSLLTPTAVMPPPRR